MITRLDRLQGRDIYENTALAKLNEVIDAVNELQKLKAPTKNIQDEFAEQRKWIGKLCKFWEDTSAEDKENAYIGILSGIITSGRYLPEDAICSYGNCEPVKPDDDIIYKGEQNDTEAD